MSATGSRLCWLLAAASLGLGACASSPLTEVPASDYQAAPRSLLVSSADYAFVQADVRQGERAATVLARREGASAPVPVAIARYKESDGDASVSVQFLPNKTNPEGDVAALEQLYAMMLRHDALGRYCLAVGPRPCDDTSRSLSHEELLRELAAKRQATVALVSHSPSIPPWRSISMSAVAQTKADSDDDVAVKVADESRPMQGVTVYFNRAPHSVCSGRTGPNGVASCRLVDQHGDEDDHAGDTGHPQVVVTYPGNVGADRVLLPMTFVLPERLVQ